MNGTDYMRKVCPTTSNGKDPNREDVADAYDDGYAQGYKEATERAVEFIYAKQLVVPNIEELINELRKYMEGQQ